MELIPSRGANNLSANQEIPRFSWNPEVYYLFHKSPPPTCSILSQIISVHTPHPTT